MHVVLHGRDDVHDSGGRVVARRGWPEHPGMTVGAGGQRRGTEFREAGVLEGPGLRARQNSVRSFSMKCVDASGVRLSTLRRCTTSV